MADLGRGLACVRPFDRLRANGLGAILWRTWRVVGRPVRERAVRLRDGGGVLLPEGVGRRDVPPLWIRLAPGSTLLRECWNDGVAVWVGSTSPAWRPGRAVRERPLRVVFEGRGLVAGELLADAARWKALRQAPSSVLRTGSGRTGLGEGTLADLRRELACVRPFDRPLRRCSGRGQGERVG